MDEIGIYNVSENRKTNTRYSGDWARMSVVTEAAAIARAKLPVIGSPMASHW